MNADLDTLYSWVNGGGAMWNDGSVAFSGIPSGPNADPTSANQLTRKSYVDGKVTNMLAYSGSAGLKVLAGSSVVTTTISGSGTVGFTPAFPTSLLTVVACVGDWGGTNPIVLDVIWSGGTGVSSFNFKAFFNNVGLASSSIRVNWIAVGT